MSTLVPAGRAVTKGMASSGVSVLCPQPPPPPTAHSLPLPATRQKTQVEPVFTQQLRNPPARLFMHLPDPSRPAYRHPPPTPHVPSHRCHTVPWHKAGGSCQGRGANACLSLEAEK